MRAWIELSERNYRQRAALDFTSMRIAQVTDAKTVQDYLRQLTEESN